MKLLKKKEFKRGGVLLLLIISIISIFSFSPIHKITSNIDLLAFFDNNTYEEKPLSEVVNTMYVTMIDNNHKVVATTNPKIEVDKDYTFSDEQVPIKQPNINDTYKILYEIADTNDENGYAKMEEGVVYTLELPEYINPQEVYEEPITKKCTEFTKKGKSIACGGIYKENDNYIFKVKFRDILNKKDVKASYQYQIKLDKTIEDVVFNIKTIDFKLPGVIQLFMKKEEIIEQGNDYTLKVENNGYTSNTQNYIKWTITINDLIMQSHKMDGILTVNFSDFIGLEVTQRNWFTNLKVFADGKELSLSKGSQFQYYLSPVENTPILQMDINNFVKEDLDERLNNSSSPFAYLFKSLKIDFKSVNPDFLYNIKEWKIEIITRDYSPIAEKEKIFKIHALFEDNISNGKYVGEDKNVKEIEDFSIETSVTGVDVNNYNIPNTLKYELNITSQNNNVMKITDIPNYFNDMNIYYYLQSSDFVCQSVSNNEKLIKFYIDGEEIQFTTCCADFYALVNGRWGSPGLHEQLKSISSDMYDAYNNSNDCILLYSNKTNEDGEYYYMVLTKDTYDNAKVVSKNGGFYEFSSTVGYDQENIPAPWSIHLYNISGKEIKIELTQKLSIEKIMNDENSGKIENKAIVSNGVFEHDSISIYEFSKVKNPLKIESKILNQHYIMWTMKFDPEILNVNETQYKNSSSLRNEYFILDIPDELEINNHGLLSTDDEIITHAYGRHSFGTTNNIYYCNKYRLNDINCEIYTNSNTIGLELKNSNYYKANKKYFSLNKNQYYNYSRPAHFHNGKLEYSFITYVKDLNYYNLYVNVYYGFEKGSEVPSCYQCGSSSLDYLYKSTGYTQLPYARKSHVSTSVIDNNILKEWSAKYNLSEATNGMVQFRDYFKVSTEEERIIAENTKLKSVAIKNIADKYFELNESRQIPLEEFTRSTDGSLKYCFSHERCIKILFNYPYCTNYTSNNEDCGEKNENLRNGFSLQATGMNDLYYMDIRYITETNMDKIKGLGIDQTKSKLIHITNNANSYQWYNTTDIYYYNNEQYKYHDSVNAIYELLADLSIDKKTDFDDDLNYKNDSKKQEVIATIGYTSSKYLDITDFIDGISNLKYNSESKKYDKEDLSTELNKLKEIRKYIDISNLKISIQNHYNGTYKDIYSNGSFISEYTGSTLEYINNSNELYKLHLVRSDGEDIPALRDVKITYDMTFNPDKDNSYRLNNVYKGGKFYISTNVEGIRTYENASNGNAEGLSYNNKNVIVKKLTTQDGDYENKIDSTNKTLTVYVSNTPASIGADYLEPPTILKQETGTLTTNGQSTWQVTYNVNSTGKSEKADFIINDTLSFKIDGDSDYNERIISILQKYVKYKDIKVYYNGKNTTNSDNPIYSYNNVLDSNQNISVNGITGTLKNGSSSYSLKLSSFDYGDVVIVTYGLDLDFESAYQEILEKGYIDSDYKLKDTKQSLKITYTNGVINPNYSESLVEKSGNKVSVSDFMPTIHKQNRGTSNDETSWEISFNTGTNSNNIKVVDNIEVSSEEEGLKEIINNSLILKDLEIKIGEDIIYSNNSFTNEWEDNITIKNKSLGYEFIFKDTSNNKFISDNKKVIISYKTGIDNNKYNGKKSGLFSLNNKATITKADLSSSDEVSASEINYEFPMTVNKEFLGNNDDLTETNWKITIDSGKIDRNNLIINDTSTLGMDFGKYLSISNIKVLLNGNEISNYRLLDKDDNDLVLNKDGVYEFKILLDKLEKDSTLEVIYTLKVNKDEYIIHDEVLDNELLINNNVNVTSSDGSDINDDDRGSSKVLSKLTKQFDFLGYDDEGNPKIRWYIDINLKDNYNLEDLVNKEIIITDELSDILELIEGSIQLNERTITSNGISIGSNIDSNNYELNTDNNIVQVKILDPISTNNIRISFDTNCLASISELENYVTLRVGEEKEEIKSSKDIRIFSNFASGIISSREVLEYRINAKKYLDGKLSNKSFAFSLVETDENGEEIENGFKTTNTNSDDGAIIFNSIVFDTEGFHYYKIKEIIENDENIIYDNTEYILRIKTIENRGIIIVDDIKILDSDSNEIVFNNRTTPKEEKPTINNILVNPNTGRSLVFILCLLGTIIIGTYILKKKRVA